jgi:hypothetical protein
MISILSQIIPVFIITGFVLFPDQSIILSESILGRIIAVSIIILYTSIDFEYGFFACVLVLLFYHFSLADKMFIVNHPFRYEAIKRIDGYENIQKPNDRYAEDEKAINSIKPYNGSKSESYSEISLENLEDNSDEQVFLQKKRDQLADMFRQENCKDGQLLYKGNSVNNEMAPHVFSELKYTNDKCNPCDKFCKFSIVEERFKTEKSLAPVSARESQPSEKIGGQFEPVMSYFKNTFNQFFVYK